jgi:protein-S-isoprenylcysteine O-methyltransferase Ste14
MFKMQFTDPSFYVTYLIVMVFSFIGLLIVNMYRHRREEKRLREKLERVMKDESAVWAE